MSLSNRSRPLAKRGMIVPQRISTEIRPNRLSMLPPLKLLITQLLPRFPDRSR
jgi:hypothetical protein